MGNNHDKSCVKHHCIICEKHSKHYIQITWRELGEYRQITDIMYPNHLEELNNVEKNYISGLPSAVIFIPICYSHFLSRKREEIIKNYYRKKREEDFDIWIDGINFPEPDKAPKIILSITMSP